MTCSILVSALLAACCASAQQLVFTQAQQDGPAMTRLVLVKPGSRLFTFSSGESQPGPQWTPLLQGRPLLSSLPNVFDDQQWGNWASLQLQALDPARTLLPLGGGPQGRPCPRHAAMLAAAAAAQRAQQGLLGGMLGLGGEPRLERLPSGRFSPLDLMREALSGPEGEEEASEGPEAEAEEEQSAGETRALALEQQAAAAGIPQGVADLPLQEGDRTEEHFSMDPREPLWARAVEAQGEGPLGPLDPPRPPPEGPLIPSGISDLVISALLALACIIVWGRAMYSLYVWGAELRARRADDDAAAAAKLREPLLAPLSPEKPLAKPAPALLAPVEVARDSIDAKKYVDFTYVPLKSSA